YMKASERRSAGSGAADVRTAPLSGESQAWETPPDKPGRSGAVRPRARRAWEALAWAAGAAGLLLVLLRVSMTVTPPADASSIALQAQDLLHGNVLLHGWLTGDVTFYTFELPLFALAEVFLGLHAAAVHAAMALIDLIVAACAAAVAVTGSQGIARAGRAVVVIAVIGAPALVPADRWLSIGLPDHTGTTVFLLLGCLLVDRALSWRWTAPLLCLLLCAGQLGDVTVRYVYVPAIALVCALVVARTRRLRSADAAIVAAALGSVPLSLAVRAVLRHLGAYQMVAPSTAIAPISSWAHNVAVTWQQLRTVFGAQAPSRLSAGDALFGSACLLAVAVGFGWTLWRWRTAQRVDQVLVVAIAVNLGVYAISTMASRPTPQEVTGVPVLGAVLAARTLMPASIPRPWAAALAAPVFAAALVPLCLVAAQPSAVPFRQPLSTWLQAHGLRHGLAMYWDAPDVTLLTSGEVQLRAVIAADGKINPFEWETQNTWFNPAEHYANFVACVRSYPLFSRTAERVFGRPASIRYVDGWVILVYHRNLLEQVSPAVLPATR
ncbi:MAG: hypothetical protein ACRDKL_03590, partial [Solirubrobacteraceae bacterium]